jgi:bacterioferritin
MSNQLNEYLNKAIAREMQVAIQYLWQHVVVKGVLGQVVAGQLRDIGIVEMKHAEKIAERLDYLGGIPTTKPTTIAIGKDWKEMIALDVKAEVEAKELYKEIVALAAKEKDTTTRLLFEEILSDEEEHHDYFTRVLE